MWDWSHGEPGEAAGISEAGSGVRQVWGQAFDLDDSPSRCSGLSGFECGPGDTGRIFHAQLFQFTNKPGDPPSTPTHQTQPTPWFPLQTSFRDRLHFWPKLLRSALSAVDWPGWNPSKLPTRAGSWAPGRPHSPAPGSPDASGATHIDEALLVLLRHLGQLVVAAGQVPLEALQGRDGNILHLPPLSPAAGRWQAQPADAAASAHPRRQHIALVELPLGDLRSREWGHRGATATEASTPQIRGPPATEHVCMLEPSCHSGGRGLRSQKRSHFTGRPLESSTLARFGVKKGIV